MPDAELSPHPVPERVCARCRQRFEGDATLLFQTDWWLCETCQPILMPAPRS